MSSPEGGACEACGEPRVFREREQIGGDNSVIQCCLLTRKI